MQRWEEYGTNRSIEYLQSLARELIKYPDETEWIEFKCNNKDPQMIGEYISAISNSAALWEKPKGYLVWGVGDVSHKIQGTSFDDRKMKKRNEELELWLARMLSPRISFRFLEVPFDDKMVLLMEIPCAEVQPVRFSGTEYIRVDTNKKKLKEFPDIEFSNAGGPLVAIERIVDTVPVSRNENIAGFLNKCGICEERGSRYNKIIEATGKNELLAPRIENQSNQFTKAVLFAKIPFEMITKEDKIRTCYMQACLAYVNFNAINNSDIRAVFGLSSKESYKASRVIKDSLEAQKIRPLDENTAPRYMKYIPYWA